MRRRTGRRGRHRQELTDATALYWPSPEVDDGTRLIRIPEYNPQTGETTDVPPLIAAVGEPFLRLLNPEIQPISQNSGSLISYNHTTGAEIPYPSSVAIGDFVLLLVEHQGPVNLTALQTLNPTWMPVTRNTTNNNQLEWGAANTYSLWCHFRGASPTPFRVRAADFQTASTYYAQMALRNVSRRAPFRGFHQQIRIGGYPAGTVGVPVGPLPIFDRRNAIVLFPMVRAAFSGSVVNTVFSTQHGPTPELQANLPQNSVQERGAMLFYRKELTEGSLNLFERTRPTDFVGSFALTNVAAEDGGNGNYIDNRFWHQVVNGRHYGSRTVNLVAGQTYTWVVRYFATGVTFNPHFSVWNGAAENGIIVPFAGGLPVSTIGSGFSRVDYRPQKGGNFETVHQLWMTFTAGVSGPHEFRFGFASSTNQLVYTPSQFNGYLVIDNFALAPVSGLIGFELTGVGETFATPPRTQRVEIPGPVIQFTWTGSGSADPSFTMLELNQMDVAELEAPRQRVWFSPALQQHGFRPDGLSANGLSWNNPSFGLRQWRSGSHQNVNYELHSENCVVPVTLDPAAPGNYYFEVDIGAQFGSPSTRDIGVGIASVLGAIDTGNLNNRVADNGMGDNAGTVGYSAFGEIYNESHGVAATVASYTAGDVIGVQINMNANTATFYKNGVPVQTVSLVLRAGWRAVMRVGNRNGGRFMTMRLRAPFTFPAPGATSFDYLAGA